VNYSVGLEVECSASHIVSFQSYLSLYCNTFLCLALRSSDCLLLWVAVFTNDLHMCSIASILLYARKF